MSFMPWNHFSSCNIHPKINAMKVNMGSIDRTVRIIVAIVLATLYFTGTITGTLGTIALVVGGIFLFTSVISFCPLYALFGMSTCPAKKS